MELKKTFLLIFFLLSGFIYNVSAGTGNGFSTTGIFEIIQNNPTITHTVSKGETVYSIASAYNITVQELYRLNPNAEKGLKTGDKLQIQKVKATSYSNHVIETKETLYSVSRMYGISADELKKANPGLNETSFSIGKTIRVPISANSLISATTNLPTIEHRVRKGETLYSISKDYKLTEDVILKMNPALKDKGLKEGMVLNVPKRQTENGASSNQGYGNPNMEHKVQKGETIYSISKNYGLSEEAIIRMNPTLSDKGLKEGMVLNIPRKQIQDMTVISNRTKVTNTSNAQRGETVRIGIVLPFLDDKGSIQKEKLAEYYEGFLLAVKKLKEKGLNAEIYTFDTGSETNTKKLEGLLETNEMKSLHLIIGGVSKQQINVLTKFAQKTGIKYVIPFGSTNDILLSPSVYQITTPHSSLYSQVTKVFKEDFSDDNIIFVSEAGSDNDKLSFVEELKKDLTRSGIQFKTTASSTSLLTDLRKVMDSSKKNILIPTSSSEITLKRIFAAINSVSTESISLFGYPEWQTYNHQTSNLHKYNSYIYSIFFLDEGQKEVQDFANDYKKWYNKNLINSYPKFGYLGYDTGLWFLTALNNNGSAFEGNISNLNASTLQSNIHFKQTNNNSGYINNGLYLIHYKSNSDIEKIDISK